MPYRKVSRVLRWHGFQPVRQRGSHVFFEHADGRTTIVPRHGDRAIPAGLIRKIIADTRLPHDAFE